MGVSSSLYASISGLNTLGNAMSVLGDNIANVNTIAFKSSRATFQDVLSQSVATASGTSQVGRGVTLTTIDGIFAQGSFESTATETDLAIGGQGFFMLRASDNAAADMYTRAGEFRFDQEGNLVSPSGHFVQGWAVDSASNEIVGTIGDISIGKNTPPVATDRVEVIVNLDSRKANETNELRLFDAWDGRNFASVNPAPGIDSANYEYTSAVKIYDSKGASHDVSIYFDRTTNDNEWEFLVTCDPTEDFRVLESARDLTHYSPDNTYNYNNHKGAGALMYGVVNFNTSGDIARINAWKVPPDGDVDPATNTNRVVLDTTDSYYSFDANFTGADTNQAIEINLGAKYTGLMTNQSQILVSDSGLFSNAQASEFITGETTWGGVYNQAGTTLTASAGTPVTFSFSGYDQDGVVTSGTYVITDPTIQKVQGLLDAIQTTFVNTSASIDAAGRLKLTDNSGGESAFSITSFTNDDVSGEDFFGSQIDIASSKTRVVSTDRALSSGSGTPLPVTASTLWSTVFSSGGVQVANGETIQFSGTKGDGTDIPLQTYTVDTTGTTTIQDFLTEIEELFDVDASIDLAGRLVLADRLADRTGTYTSALDFNIVGGTAPDIFGTGIFELVQASTEDGSRQGDQVSTAFETEALASTQYANSSTTVFQDQNGFAAGFLQSVSVDTKGVITGHYSNGQVLEKAQVALATFSNLNGLSKEGGNIFTETTESGAPITGLPGTNGLGSISPNSLEQSNVDLGTEFVRLITTQRGFQANSRVITVTDEMLNDLINIKR